jgi:tripartite motif-containing protein 23
MMKMVSAINDQHTASTHDIQCSHPFIVVLCCIMCVCVVARVQAIDSRIPLMFTRGDNRVHIGASVEMRVVVLGLDGAGKSSVLAKLKHCDVCLLLLFMFVFLVLKTMPTAATIGFNIETMDYKGLKLTFWDVGGMPKLRPLWKHYYLNAQGSYDAVCR